MKKMVFVGLFSLVSVGLFAETQNYSEQDYALCNVVSESSAATEVHGKHAGDCVYYEDVNISDEDCKNNHRHGGRSSNSSHMRRSMNQDRDNMVSVSGGFYGSDHMEDGDSYFSVGGRYTDYRFGNLGYYAGGSALFASSDHMSSADHTSPAYERAEMEVGLTYANRLFGKLRWYGDAGVVGSLDRNASSENIYAVDFEGGLGAEVISSKGLFFRVGPTYRVNLYSSETPNVDPSGFGGKVQIGYAW